MSEQGFRLPLRDRAGATRAYAVVDVEDAGLAAYRWSLQPDGDGRKVYVRRRVGRGSVALHREILGLTTDDPRQADHINGDTLDNRRKNLRIATHAQNAQNRGRNVSNLSSRYRNVTWDKRQRRWQASAMLAYKRHHIGYFTDEDEAGAAAAAWRAAHMPFSKEGSDA